jgi:cytochrome c
VYADAHVGFNRFRNDLSQGGHKAYLLFRDVDLSRIRQLDFHYASQDAEGTIEVRLDSEAGPVIARTAYTPTGSWDHYAHVSATLTQPVEGMHHLYILGLKPLPPNDAIIRFKAIQFIE